MDLQRHPPRLFAARLKALAAAEDMRNVAELIIAKQRHGATSKVMLHFDPETCSFGNLVRGHSA
jgi:replicative DNA helicase